MLTVKTLDELHAIALGAVRAYVEGADTSPGSDYDTSARMVAAAALLNQRQAEDLAQQVLPEGASDEFVELHAAARGLSRAPAAPSSGRVQVTASSGTATQPDASTLTHADGTVFATTAPATMALPGWTGKTVAPDSTVARLLVAPDASGMAAGDLVTVDGAVRAIREVVAAINAIDLWEPLPATPAATTAISATRGALLPFAAAASGAAGNKPVGDELVLASPATGVSSGARIVECGGGGDEGTVEELRARCVDHDAGRPASGNEEHVRELARTVTGHRIADACVFPGFRGLGTIDVVVLGVAGARVVSAQAVAEVVARLAAEFPYHADVEVSAQELTSTEHDVDITVTTEIGYERDFVHAGVPIATSSTTTLVRLATSLAGFAEVGDRVLLSVHVAGRWKTYQRRITSIDAVAANTIEIDSPLPRAPLSTDPAVLPGGPLAEPLIAALEGLFESLGPSRLNSSPLWTWERHPPPSVAWDDTLRLARIDAIVMGHAGVVNVSVASPASDVQPGAKETLRRGRIIVRFEEA